VNKLIVFYDNITNAKKEISISAYYPMNYSIMDIPIDRINLSNIPKGIIYFDYDELNVQKVIAQSLSDTIKQMSSSINGLETFELNIYSPTLISFFKNKSKSKNKHIIDKYNYILLDTKGDYPQLSLINSEFCKELKKRMSQY